MNPTINSKAIIGKALTFSLALCLTGATSLFTSTAHAADFSVSLNTTQDAGSLYTADQLDGILAPIALYSDPLLAQVLVASTFSDQIAEASQLLSGSDGVSIDDQSWDESVKAVAHYPKVLFALAAQQDWTSDLGQAYIEQTTDVMVSVQRLRAMALAQGNLVTTSQQRIVAVGGVIQILPARVGFAFLPTYDVGAVYSSPAFISFGSALQINSTWDGQIDWHERSICDRHHHHVRIGDHGRFGRMRRARGPIRNRFNGHGRERDRGRDRGRVTRNRFNPNRPNEPRQPKQPGTQTQPKSPKQPKSPVQPKSPTKPTKPTTPKAGTQTPGSRKQAAANNGNRGPNTARVNRGQQNHGQMNKAQIDLAQMNHAAMNRSQPNNRQMNRASFNNGMNRGSSAGRSGRSGRR